ncbi:hypothetical protein GUITHDRAFT_102314 [Guillardia theta CCMP2712]|uniref:Uncharacterized protein n=1 Tax=Guillardia theta (strain CCMP2712) TaxID=905079 RepID=L1JU32_GUITC|nr:hypothetical protein GUITHDRAFT_102314 [Guillardia theta CCMP2712]EKX51710.1 hypothetical protein GUITHDRAFT_102314 [Guillardia theta CCMP2712]|eukprot:XP_005838690.1 hypothetical protein GUITHDRAFT_102314 [Guillardia theta CCMP2712]
MARRLAAPAGTFAMVGAESGGEEGQGERSIVVTHMGEEGLGTIDYDVFTASNTGLLNLNAVKKRFGLSVVRDLNGIELEEDGEGYTSVDELLTVRGSLDITGTMKPICLKRTNDTKE